MGFGRGEAEPELGYVLLLSPAWIAELQSRPSLPNEAVVGGGGDMYAVDDSTKVFLSGRTTMAGSSHTNPWSGIVSPRKSLHSAQT